MEITIDIKNWIKSGIGLEWYLMLQSIFEKQIGVSESVMSKHEDTAMLFQMEGCGYVLINGDHLSDVTLTDKAKALFSQPDSPKTWITEWMELWPRQAKEVSSVQWPSPSECLTKMERFLKKNKKVTKDEIFQATKNYIEKYRLRNFEYMRHASNFIYKGNVDSSDLMACIIDVRNGITARVSYNNFQTI